MAESNLNSKMVLIVHHLELARNDRLSGTGPRNVSIGPEFCVGDVNPATLARRRVDISIPPREPLVAVCSAEPVVLKALK